MNKAGMTSEEREAESVISAQGIVKRFGSVLANRGAALEIARGEIHAVVGENGAGKSTLMRILAGLFPPDAGRVLVNGRDVTGWTTLEAISAGVGMVHQHFMLVPTLTVAENLVLGQETRRGMRFDRAAAEHEVRVLTERTGLNISPSRLVSELSVGEAQRVEILKVLWRGARILILDEPTAVLSPNEVRDLWKVIRALRDAGDTVVLITHKLDEVMDISDTVTVMRGGETVGTLPTAAATAPGLARMMVGRDVSLVSIITNEPAPASGEIDTPVPELAKQSIAALTVRGLVAVRNDGHRALDGVSFSVAAGEVLGIAGVEGNGQTELIETIAGLHPLLSGSIQLGARDITNASVRERTDAGLSHVPEDRQRRGLVLDYTIADNLILGRQRRFSARGVMDRSRVEAHAESQIAAFDIRPAEPRARARALSGGNQQKVVIAREVGRDFAVLLASQPTRGVDVGGIEFIHARIRAAREAGKAVLLVSADLGEVLALSDRVAVLYGGRLVITLPRARASAEALGPYMTGVRTGDGRWETGVGND